MIGAGGAAMNAPRSTWYVAGARFACFPIRSAGTAAPAISAPSRIFFHMAVAPEERRSLQELRQSKGTGACPSTAGNYSRMLLAVTELPELGDGGLRAHTAGARPDRDRGGRRQCRLRRSDEGQGEDAGDVREGTGAERVRVERDARRRDIRVQEQQGVQVRRGGLDDEPLLLDAVLDRGDADHVRERVDGDVGAGCCRGRPAA